MRNSSSFNVSALIFVLLGLPHITYAHGGHAGHGAGLLETCLHWLSSPVHFLPGVVILLLVVVIYRTMRKHAPKD